MDPLKNSPMKKLSKKFVFYFVIMEENKNDNMSLQRLIHSLVPQAIIESIYDFNEAIIYFKESKLQPHLLFLSEEMSKAGLNFLSDGSMNNLNLSNLPLVFLSDNKSKQSSEQFIYSKPYDPKNFLSIVGAMNQKWVA